MWCIVESGDSLVAEIVLGRGVVDVQRVSCSTSLRRSAGINVLEVQVRVEVIDETCVLREKEKVESSQRKEKKNKEEYSYAYMTYIHDMNSHSITIDHILQQDHTSGIYKNI